MEKELSEDGRIVCIVRDMAFVERGGQKILSSENILKVADENRWKYETFPQEILIDITDIFEEESEEGNVLLDFLTTVKKFRVETSATEVKQALQAFEEASVEKDGKLFLKRANNLVIIHR